ncbi:MAG TPA: hypothetical protein VF777_04035 [Phycisphaerales bacterium]
MSSPVYEKLGAFYLGKLFDPAAWKRSDDYLLYDSRDLVTHAVCVGMTGSGKTGLCLGLLEEAAIDGIPSLIIDPKGDLANLLLTFPNLAPSDFRPWINEDDARRKNISPDDFAKQQSEQWRKGLDSWGQDPSRIQRLRDAAEFVVYTPGSTAGVPLSVLRSFAAPPPAIRDEPELLHERVETTVSGILSMLGRNSTGPTPESAFLAALIEQWWGAGEDLDLAKLIQAVNKPPMSHVGAMALEEFFPAGDRFQLAVALNSLLASPGMKRLGEGAPIDIQQMLFAEGGKPRCAIVSIAHLGDNERMFVVSLLLNEMLSWVRKQSGTTSLRALLYMDEIAGYVPPVQNPPSKRPLLTLMKQARAFGVGVVLATQNPVDLDYKGLSNAGTWFIGRLQTDRDKQRVLDGLEGASAAASATFDRAQMDTLISKLGNRVFLMNNVHEPGPVLLESRWCLSYLRGPLTRDQIKILMDPLRDRYLTGAPRGAMPSPTAASVAANAAQPPTTASSKPATANHNRPVLSGDVPEFFIPARTTDAIEYRPMLLGLAKVFYGGTRAGLSHEEQLALLTPITDGAVAADWEHAQAVELTDKDLDKEPVAGATFAPLAPDAAKAKAYDKWKKELADGIFRSRSLEMFRSNEHKLASEPGESEAAFLARLSHAIREKRDAAMEKLKAKYGPKVQTLQDRLRRAEQAAEVQREQATGAKIGSALSIGSAIFGALLGRKVANSGNLGRAATAARGVSRASKESSDVARAEENVAAASTQLDAIKREFEEELQSLQSLEVDPASIEKISLRPKKTDVNVRAVVLAWAPHTRSGEPAW